MLRILITVVAMMSLAAEDIVTLDGKTYTGITELTVKPDGLSFILPTGPVKVKFTNLSEDIRRKYNYDPFEAAIYTAHQNRPMVMKKTMAFRMDQLEEAKRKAFALGRPLGFAMVWDQFFDKPATPMGPNASSDALAHFHAVYDQVLVMVYVRHETELGNVPPAVAKGFFGPDEGGAAPNLCVTSPDCSEYICEIPMGGHFKSTGKLREEVFRAKNAVIKDWLAKHPEVAAAAVKAGSASAAGPATTAGR